jgi:uridine kinase
MIILITGASGSGKTTILKVIEQQLPANKISVNYFDDIGVPSVEAMIAEYGSCEKWQEAKTNAWEEKLAKITKKEFIFLEGSFNPEFAKNYSRLFCIHADRAIREERLINHRNQPELATEDMDNLAQILKNNTLKMGGVVIDSSNRNVDIIAQDIIYLIYRKTI